jgi:hypothetical protein
VFEWLKGRPGRSRLETLLGGPTYAAYREMVEARSKQGAAAPAEEAEMTLVYAAVGPQSAVTALEEATDALPGWQEALADERFTPTQASLLRETVLSVLDDVPAPAEFTYDSAGSLLKAANGDLVDLYVVRGDREKLERFNDRVALVGGELGSVGADGLAVALDAFGSLLAGEQDAQTTEEAVALGVTVKAGAADRLRLAARAALDRYPAEQADKRIGRLLKKKSRGNLKQREVDELVALSVAQAVRETRNESAGLAEVRATVDPIVQLGLGNLWLSQAQDMADAATAERPVLVAVLPKAKAGWSLDLDWDCLCRAWDNLTASTGLVMPVVPVEASGRGVGDDDLPLSDVEDRECEDDPFCEGEPGEPAVGRSPSPSRLRYRLRHKYGVRYPQLVGRGLPADVSRHMADRVRHMLRQGTDIVEAIELAQTEWLVKEGRFDEVDILNLRRDLGMTVPRLIEQGHTRDYAWFVAGLVHAFMEVGADSRYAVTVATELWDVKGTERWAEAHGRLRGVWQEMLYQKFFATLTEAPPGEPVTEVTSGARWVARVAQQLREEPNPGKGRRFTQEEALAQAWTEWASMDPEVRFQVRKEHRLADECKEGDWPENHGPGQCETCDGIRSDSASYRAKQDEALIFSPHATEPEPEPEPATEPKFGPSPLAGTLLGFLIQMASNPSTMPLGLFPDFSVSTVPQGDDCDPAEEDEVRGALEELLSEMAPGEAQTPEGYRRLYVAGLMASGYWEDAEWMADRRTTLVAAGVPPEVASKIVATDLVVRQAARTKAGQTAEAVRYFTEETERGSYNRQQFIVPLATELYAEGRDRRDALQQAKDEWDKKPAEGPSCDWNVEPEDVRIEEWLRRADCPEPEWANEDGTIKVFPTFPSGFLMLSDFPDRKVVGCRVVKSQAGRWEPLSWDDPNWALIGAREGSKPLAAAGFPFMSEFLATYAAQSDSRRRDLPPGWGEVRPAEPYRESDLPDVVEKLLTLFVQDHWVFQHFDDAKLSGLLAGLRGKRDLPHLPLVEEACLHVCAAAQIGPPPEPGVFGFSDAYSAWCIRVRELKKRSTVSANG